MSTPKGKSLERENLFGMCKNFLCPPESRIREWFPNQLAIRLRAKALDPYGLMQAKVHMSMSNKKDDDDNGFLITIKCKNENCHAKIILRKVKSDPEGNTYGLFGCNAHQHELPMKNRSEIVFENKACAQKFYEQNFKMMYLKSGKIFPCRRRNLQPDYGYHNCTSVLSLYKTFKTIDKDNPIIEETPHSLAGIFYHNHENDKKYHRDPDGGWKKQGSYADPTKKQNKTSYPRVRNGKIFPLSARKTHTIEELLTAQKWKRKDWVQKPKKKKKCNN